MMTHLGVIFWCVFVVLVVFVVFSSSSSRRRRLASLDNKSFHSAMWHE